MKPEIFCYLTSLLFVNRSSVLVLSIQSFFFLSFFVTETFSVYMQKEDKERSNLNKSFVRWAGSGCHFQASILRKILGFVYFRVGEVEL